jgi:hypothetical protein
MSRAGRAWAVLALVAGGAPAWVACNGDTEAPFADDAGALPDATTGDDVVQPTFDAAPVVLPDANDASAPLPDVVDAAPAIQGACEPVQGPACDLVKQDCPSGKECLTRLLDGGAPDVIDASPYTTACEAVTSSEHLGKGHGCCPSAAQKQCDPGLECIGDPNLPCSTDGGVQPGRCTPHCCGIAIDGGDDSLCGAADPEGWQGHCDTTVVDGLGTPLYNACTYTRPCKPFGVQPCPGGFACEVQDPTGTSGCSVIYSVDGGPPPTEGQTCVALNNCADGLVCLNTGNVGNCYMMCLTPGATTPFDAGALASQPLHGGCPAGEQCTLSVQGFPPWISFCQ